MVLFVWVGINNKYRREWNIENNNDNNNDM